jgi:hypothetical protein
MMGPTKLSTIRAEVRMAFKMSDAELLAWFNGQLEDLGRKPQANKGEMDTLRLLRDALVKEVKRAGSRRRAGHGTRQSKS